MTLLRNDDQEFLRTVLVGFADAQFSTERVRQSVNSAESYDQGTWKRLSAELAVPGIAIPESYGGSGGDNRTRCVVLEELGARLAPTPFFGSAVLATDALLTLGDEAARQEFLPRIAAGELLASTAFAEGAELRWLAGTPLTQATSTDSGWRLNGQKSMVIDGVSAGLLIVTAATSDGVGFFAVLTDDAGVEVTALPSSDLTRELAAVDLTDAPARRLDCAEPTVALQRMWDLASVALAAEMLGGMRRAVEVSVDYAKVRHQFGRPIGSFQAIKHRLAEMYVKVELSTAVVRNAAAAADGIGEDLPIAATLAHLQVARYFRDIGDDIIHVHGGIGFTWEHEAHLYFRRAISSSVLLGSPEDHLDRLADLLGL